MIAFDPALWQRGGETERRRRQVVAIMQAALEAVDPGLAVRGRLQREGEVLSVAGQHYDLAETDRV